MGDSFLGLDLFYFILFTFLFAIRPVRVLFSHLSIFSLILRGFLADWF